MILKEILDWVKAYRDCFAGRATELESALRALDKGGRWQLGLRSDTRFAKVSFRYFGTARDFGDFQNRASQVFPGLPRAKTEPLVGLPWLSFTWDRETGALSKAWSYEGGEARAKEGARVLFAPKPFGKQFLTDPALKAVFADLSALCPIKEIVSQWDVQGGKRKAREPWSIRFEKGVSWPAFIRLSVSAAFTEDHTQWAYLILDRKVEELECDGAALGVYLGA